MFNFYPWGLSLNMVMPITRILFVQHPHLLELGAGAELDKVELQDQFVGLKSQNLNEDVMLLNMKRACITFIAF